MLSKTALQKLILTSNNITNSQRTNRKYEIHTGFELFLATSINSCLLTTVLLFIYWAFYNEQKTAWPTAVHHIISNRIQRRSLLCRRRRVLLHTSTKEYVMSVALLWQQHYNFKWKSDQSLLMPVLIARMDTTRTVVWFERQVICELRSRIHHFGKSKKIYSMNNNGDIEYEIDLSFALIRAIEYILSLTNEQWTAGVYDV